MRKSFQSILVLTIGALLCTLGEAAKKPVITLTDDLLRMCSRNNPISSSRQKKELKWLVEATGHQSLLSSSSPQHKAACWALYQDRKQSKGRGQALYLQRYAMAVLHYASTLTNTTVWDWRMTVDEPWAEPAYGHWMSTKHHECQWYGVACTAYGKQVNKLILGYMKLNGIIPRELYLLPKLKEIDFHGNDFQGMTD
jgi:hypothetical protein